MYNVSYSIDMKENQKCLVEENNYPYATCVLCNNW